MFAIQEKIAGAIVQAWSAWVGAVGCRSLMRYSGRVARAFLGSEARGQHPADIDEVVGNDSQTYPAMHARIPLYRGSGGVRGVA